MRNPFIVVRFVVLAFLGYLNIFGIAISAWTISALKSDHVTVPSAFNLALLNSCLIVFLLSLSVVELFWSKLRMSVVRRECMWVGVKSILFFVTAFQVTAAGPPFLCKTEATIDACVSSSILVTISWISSSTLVIYFFSFLSITLAHAPHYPGIWKVSIYDVPWFVGWEQQYRDAKIPEELYCSSKDKNLLTPPLFRPSEDYDVEKHPSRFHVSSPQANTVKSYTPSWAKEIETRRGIDNPFASKPPSPEPELEPKPKPIRSQLKSYWSTTTTMSPPPVPPKAHISQMQSIYIDSRRETLPVITPSPSRPLSYGIFPDGGFDPEQPVRTNRISEWVRADMNSRHDYHAF